MTYEEVARGLWLAMLLSWFIASFWVSRATARGSFRLSVGHLVGFWLGFVLLFTPAAGDQMFGGGLVLAGPVGRTGRLPLWSLAPAFGWLLVVAQTIAFAFAWWARVHIGQLWSGFMIVREDHRIVDTGPYRLVRHPIYTAFIGGAWAFAVVVATPAALIGAAVLTAVMALKARQEETFLRHELGAGAYDAYAARTPMLAPFMPVRARRAEKRG